MTRIVVLVVIASACDPTPVETHAPRAPMIETVTDIARFMAQSSLTADDVIRRFGAVTIDHGRGGSIELANSDARFTRVQLWRNAAGAPYLLDLELAPASRIHMADLRASFGAAKPVTASAIGSPPTMLFGRVANSASHDVTLVARIDGELATAIVFRRDASGD